MLVGRRANKALDQATGWEKGRVPVRPIRRFDATPVGLWVALWVALACAWSLVGASPAAAQGNSCNYAFDGECDEPTYCSAGTDSWDCRTEGRFGANDCFWAYDGECDEPEIGTGICPANSDRYDCSGIGSIPSDNSCVFAFDGECDHPGVGSASCTMGTDTADCGPTEVEQSVVLERGIGGNDSCQWARDGECDELRYGGTGACADGTDTADCSIVAQGDNTCRWAFDRECDEPELGTGACRSGTDTGDCRALAAGGEDSCQWANDGECDEPGIGTGACTDGTDRTDCAAVAHLRNRDNSCERAFDDRCDEPQQGSGQCDPRSDTVDCIGRHTVSGVRDHYFGRDDRRILDSSQYPWSAIGEVRFRGGGACTATLVAPDIAITAAHCFFQDGRVNPAAEFLAGLSGDQHVARANVIRHFVPPAIRKSGTPTPTRSTISTGPSLSSTGPSATPSGRWACTD